MQDQNRAGKPPGLSQKLQLTRCLQLKFSNCMMAYERQKAQCLYRLGPGVLGYENTSTAGVSLAL